MFKLAMLFLVGLALDVTTPYWVFWWIDAFCWLVKALFNFYKLGKEAE